MSRAQEPRLGKFPHIAIPLGNGYTGRRENTELSPDIDDFNIDLDQIAEIEF